MIIYNLVRNGLLIFLQAIVFLVTVTMPVAAQSNDLDTSSYYSAVRYCRQNALLGLRPLSLSPDKHVLCFDGTIVPNMDFSPARNLAEAGLFVVRSGGGQAAAAIALSNIVRDHHAKVIVYDFCFSACALFFLVASDETYVLRGTLVAWHNAQSGGPAHPLCAFLAKPGDGGGKALRRGSCEGQGARAISSLPMMQRFYKERTVSPLLDLPPDSPYVRKRVTGMYADSGVDRDIAWTLHPRYYPRLFKTKIVYEAYPESQSQVDEMAASFFGLTIGKIIYDP